jgi:hypothetical protein
MAKEWYRCVCDEHKEAKTFFVKSVSYTAHMLMDQDQEIFDFLREHYGCNLRMVHRDDELDALWDTYTVDGRDPK